MLYNQYRNYAVKSSQFDPAIDIGNVLLTRSLLMDPTVNVDFSADRFHAVLYRSTLMNDMHTVQLLLAKGASADPPSSDPTPQVSPLWLAVLFEHHDLTDVLLKAGADVNRRFGLKHCCEFDYDPETSLLHVAVANCDGYLAEKLLAAGADPNACDSKGESVLQRAIDTNWHDWIAQMLIEHGARVDHEDRYKTSILHSAAASDNASLVSLVLRYGADPLSVDGDGNYALHVAAESKKENVEVVRMLIEAGVPIDENDGAKLYTPLHLALINGNENIARLLLNHGASLDKRTYLLMTPLHLAIITCRNIDMAVELLARGASVHGKTRIGSTILHDACNAESEEKIRLLLAHGADVTVKDRFGNTPFSGIKHDYSLAAYEMIKHIARLNIEDPKLVDQGDIETIMANVTMRRRYDTFMEEIEKMKAIKICNDLTFYGLFTESAEKIAPLLRNEEYLDGLASVDRASEFPSYFSQLDLNLSKAEERRNFYWAAADCLNEAFQYSLPTLVIDEIVRYLEPTDIQFNVNCEVE